MSDINVQIHNFNRDARFRPDAPVLTARLKTGASNVTWIDLGNGHDVEVTFYIDRDPERLDALAAQFDALAGSLRKLFQEGRVHVVEPIGDGPGVVDAWIASHSHGPGCQCDGGEPVL